MLLDGEALKTLAAECTKAEAACQAGRRRAGELNLANSGQMRSAGQTLRRHLQILAVAYCWTAAGQLMAVARWKAAAEEAIAKNDGEAEQWKEPMLADMRFIYNR